MNPNQIIPAIAANAAVFQALLDGIPEAQYRWKPAPEKWCLLEVICHLYDEEREDFRKRTRHVLEQPAEPMSPIDPVGWVTQRKYAEQNYQEKLEDFLSERAQSVKWLENLEEPAWHNTYDHPHFGPMSALFFLRNWLAHDHLHIKQITHLKYLYLQAQSDEPINYAGEWK